MASPLGITAEGAVLEVNTTPDAAPTWSPVIERSQLTMNKTGERIDMTTFDAEGFRAGLPGLRQINVDATGNVVPLNVAWLYLEDAWLEGENIELRGLWRTRDGGQIGWQFEATITNIGEQGDVGDRVTAPLSFEGSGRPTKVTISAGS